MMTRKEFNNAVLLKVQEMYPDCNVTITESLGNNDGTIYHITINDSKINIAPSIHLEQIPTTAPIDEVAKWISTVYESNKPSESFDMNTVLKWENVKQKVVLTLVNAERNERRLLDIPFLSWNDLAIVFRVLVETPQEGMASIVVRNELLKIWGIDVETLYRVALSNTPRLLPCESVDMDHIIAEQLCANMRSQGIPVTFEDAYNFVLQNDFHDIPMVVVSNKYRLNGAASLLYCKDAYMEIAKRFGVSKLVCFPSSIHEIITIPFEEDVSLKDCINLVRSVNTDELQPDEILSENCYLYDAQKEDFTLVTIA